MTASQPLGRELEEYAALLQGEQALLRELLDCSTAQQKAAVSRDVDALGRATLARGRVMERLATCEAAANASRNVLKAAIVRARSLPGFDAVLELQREVANMLGALSESDQRTRTAVEMLSEASRTDVHALETGGATLAAYRRVIAPPLSSAELVDRRG